MPSNIVVPEVGESIVDARVAKWLRKEGDTVSAGDPLVELETDKIDLEVGAPQAGVLSRIDRKDGDDVKVGEVLGVIDESRAGASAPAAAAAAPAVSKVEAPAPEASAPKEKDKTPRSTPTARKAAEQHEVDLVAGSWQRRCRARHAPRCRAGRACGPAPWRSRATDGANVEAVAARRRRHADVRRASAPKSACACRSGARRSPGASSKRRAPRRCSRPSTRWTCPR